MHMTDWSQPLVPANQGRILVRNRGDGMATFVGVIEVIRSVPVESIMPARLNSRLWVDEQDAKPIGSRWRVPHPSWVAESDVSSLITSLEWRSAALLDSFELCLRACHLEHGNPEFRWAIVFGAMQRSVPATHQGGVYELGQHGVHRIAEDTFIGMTIGQALREPMWGPDGRFGLAVSIDPSIYEAWVKKEREHLVRCEPEFGRYLARFAALAPPLLVYTREQREERDRVSERIVEELMQEPANELPSPMLHHRSGA